MEEILSTIAEFARKAYEGQTRKYTPEPFIAHPVRVMETCKKYTKDPCILAAALLHDVLEDTDCKKDELNHFLEAVMGREKAERTTALVVELTDIFTKKNFPHLNRRKRKAREVQRLQQISAASQTVKYADIIDNCNEIVDHDPEFARTFLSECKDLLQKINKGNPELYRKAIDMVHSRIAELNIRK